MDKHELVVLLATPFGGTVTDTTVFNVVVLAPGMPKARLFVTTPGVTVVVVVAARVTAKVEVTNIVEVIRFVIGTIIVEERVTDDADPAVE